LTASVVLTEGLDSFSIMTLRGVGALEEAFHARCDITVVQTWDIPYFKPVEELFHPAHFY
jgi:hypothetical protein